MKYLFIFACFIFSSSVVADDYPFRKGVNISHWMAQHLEGKYADPWRLSETEVEWIVRQGFDHVRIPVDGRILMSIEGKLIEELMEPFDKALSWAEEHGLGVILDMHYLPGAEFLTPAEDNALWRDERLQGIAVSLWKQLAEKYKAYGEGLRFELLNEAVAPEHSDVNSLNEKLVSAVRSVDRNRIVYVSANEWGMFKNAEYVKVFRDDRSVHYAFHYYEPLIFTHQKASWSEHTRYFNESVKFPGTLSNLDRYFPKGHEMLDLNGVELNAGQIDRDFDELGAWATDNGVHVQISEFGVITQSDADSARRWVSAVTRAAERNGFGLTIWDYKGDFRVNDSGKPTPQWEGLFEPQEP